MTLNELSNELLIEAILEEAEDNGDVMKSISKVNMNIRKASAGARIKPKLSSGKLNRAMLRKILKLASPAEIEIIATQFLGQNGLKVAKGRKKK